MRHLFSTKARITGAVVMLAFLAAAFALPAFAATDVYLDHAVVGEVPAVSGSAYHYDNFMGSNSGYASMHIYLYNASSGVQTCDASVSGGASVYRSCAAPGTARCHTINGQGQIYATCQTTF
jgi:hypothetical protein